MANKNTQKKRERERIRKLSEKLGSTVPSYLPNIPYQIKIEGAEECGDTEARTGVSGGTSTSSGEHTWN